MIEGISMGDNSISAVVAIRISVMRFINLYMLNSWQWTVGSGQKQPALICKLPTA
jgi:hypothetical protein